MNVTDPDWMDWYFNEDEQKFEWRNSTERMLVIDGKMYRNVGRSHAEKAGDGYVNYYQNRPVYRSEAPLADTERRVLDNMRQVLVYLNDKDLSPEIRSGIIGMLIHNRQGKFLENAYELASTEIGGIGDGLTVVGIAVGVTGIGAPLGYALIEAGGGFSKIAGYMNFVKHICQKDMNAVYFDGVLIGVGHVNQALNKLVDTDFQKNMLTFYFQTPSLIFNYANN